MSSTKKLIILGTGGNCIDILDTIWDINTAQGHELYECIGFLDDNEQSWGKDFYGVKVLGPLITASQYRDCLFVNGIGSASNFWKKRDIIAKTGISPDQFETIIHPTASVSRISKLGYGVVVFQNVTITSNVRIGNHVVILPNSVVSHDSVVDDYTCIAGAVCISGGVQIDYACYLGTNSSIRSNVHLERHCLVGMGAVVLENMPENSVIVGNPARILKKTIDV